MPSEDQDILAKISQLAGKINRHKNAHVSDQPIGLDSSSHNERNGGSPQTTPGWRPYRGGYSSRGHIRGGRQPQVRRNRTLVLNGNPSTDTNNSSSDVDTSNTVSTSNTAWVTKNDRHMQLINPSIFEKDSQNRAKAMEETRKQKLKQRDDREKTKFNRHLQRVRVDSNQTPGSTDSYEINVEGIRFQIAKNGSKLIKISGDQNAAKSTPKIALIGGVRFHRSKNGNMYRDGIIKAYRGNIVKKINEPCTMFSTTGSCTKGPRCRYIHDPSKVAVCREFLKKGSCPSGESCDLSHELTPERAPTCLHFARGNCSNPSCRYTHVRVSPLALVCRPFGIYGYCEKASSCPERHVHECPDFSNTGACIRKGCKLPHRYKASVMRGNDLGEQVADAENSDISSDDDDAEIDSDDVDSDDLAKEFLGDDDGRIDPDIPTQRDYVQIS